MNTPERPSPPDTWQDWIAPRPSVPGTRPELPDDLGDGGADSYTRWLDDTLLDIAPPELSPNRSTSSGARTRNRATSFWTVRGLAIGVVVAVIALVGGGVWQVRTSGHTRHIPAPALTELVSATAGPLSPPLGSPPWCAAEDGPRQLRGNGTGSTEAAPDVILALEHAYYVQRSASAIRSLLDQAGRFGTDAEIQAGIDAVPAGTEHCVQITADGPDRWAVLITEKHPDARTVVHTQTITTRQYPDRALVVAIETA